MVNLEYTTSSKRFIVDYMIRDRIGAGGCGEVYTAEHRYLGTPACVKIIRSDRQDNELKNYLWREAKVLNRLKNDHIVGLKTLTIENNEIYMIMDYVDGGDLAAFLKQAGGPLPVEEVDHILDQIADGLHYAHQQHTIHRDLKPSNILRYQDGRIVIADFGLAQVLDTALTQSLLPSRSNAGTPLYMAPEQFDGRPGYASDLYSLGVIIYQLLTGHLPFQGDNTQAEEGHRYKNPPPPHSFNQDLSTDIEEVVLKMLAKKPAERYHSALEFRRAFGNALMKKKIKTRVSPETIEGLLHLFPDDQVVLLDPGEYRGPFTINKRLHLIGAGSSTRLTTVDEPVLTLSTSGVRLENMYIQRTSEKSGEKVIKVASGVTYTLKHATLLGGDIEGAQWEDAEWQLPINGIDFGRIPLESQQTRSVSIEVKIECEVKANLSGLNVFPQRLSPGAHTLSLIYNASEQLPGTILNGSIILWSETETRTIAVTGQIEEPVTEPEAANALPHMDWDYQIQDKAAQDLLRELGNDQEKQLARQRERENPQWRREITQRSSSLLAQIFGRTPFYWYVRRLKPDQEDSEEETLELTLATDSTGLPPALADRQRTLRLIGKIHQEGRGKFKIHRALFLNTESGFANRVSLPVWIRFVPSLPGYTGIPQPFIAQLQTLLDNEIPALDGDQLQGWEELLQFYSNLYKRKQYWIAYTKHDYREGNTKVTFTLNKEEARNSEQELLSYKEFQERVQASRRERLKIFTELPKINNTRRKAGKEIGRIERFLSDSTTIIVNLEANIADQLQAGTYDLPTSGYLHFDARGNMSQVERQQNAITDLRQGRAKNPLLSDFFFDASRARIPPVIQPLDHADLLSGTCNDGQVAAIEAAISVPDLLLIQGPPGTGKTTVIAEICYQNALRDRRTLVASQSNLAVDNALGRIIHHPKIRALRKGTPDSVEDEGRDFTEERVIDTWLSNTARDCQAKLEQRYHTITILQKLLKEALRFNQYCSAEFEWEDKQTTLQRKLASAQQEILDLRKAISQKERDIEAYTSTEYAYTNLLNGTIDWHLVDTGSLLKNILLSLSERVGEQQFVAQIHECVELSRQLGLAPLAEEDPLKTVVWLKEAVHSVSHTWADSKGYLSEAEETLTRLNSIEQQQQQVALALQSKLATIQDLDRHIEQLKNTLEGQAIPLYTLENALTALKELPETGPGSMFVALRQFLNEEYKRKLSMPDASTPLQPTHIFPPTIVAVLQQDIPSNFSHSWSSIEKAIPVKIQQAINERKSLVLIQNQLDTYKQHFDKECSYVPEIKLSLEHTAPQENGNIPQNLSDLMQLLTRIKQNLDRCTELRSKPPIFMGRFFRDQEKQRLQNRLLEVRDWLMIVNKHQQRLRNLINEANTEFTTNMVRKLFTAVHGQLSEQQQEVQEAYRAALQGKHRCESERQDAQKALGAERTRLNQLIHERAEVLQRLTQTLQAVSMRDDLSEELRQLTQQQLHNQPFSSMFILEYQTAYQRWDSDTKHLEELVIDLWNQVTAAGPTIQHRLTSARSTLEQEQQQLNAAYVEQETCERALQQAPEALLHEREWWRNFWEGIPETIRPIASSEDISARPFLEKVQQQFIAWQTELEKEETFVRHYDGLVTDWITALNKISEPDRELLKEAYIKNANVIGITCGQARQLSSKDYRTVSTFDVVIIDEVSKATPPELLLPALKGKKLILIGDQHQLPPMIEDKTLDQMAEEIGQDPATYNYLNQPYFADRYNEAPDEIKCMLHIQYRMHPDIMAAINQFYESSLVSGLNQPDLERDHGLESALVRKQTHLIWARTPQISASTSGTQKISAVNKATGREVFAYKSQYNSFGEERIGTSYMNRREVEIIKKICEELQQIWKPKQIAGAAPKEIGVITFYAAQVNELERSLGTGRGNKKSPFDALNIRIGSVDRFQGMEREIIIVSMVRNNSRGDIGFAKKDERINVAFSRAQQLLIIVGCHDLFCNTARGGRAAERYSNVSKIVLHRGDFINVS